MVEDKKVDTLTQIAEKKRKNKENLKYKRDKDAEKVRGRFKFYEVPGGTLSFSFKAYKEDEVETYTLVDGDVYTIPLGVAKHLCNNGWYPEYGYIKGEQGDKGARTGFNNMTSDGMRIEKKVRRFGFESMEFADIEELQQPKDIVLVTGG